ncbi:uncharacterized protein LODBEIA_P25120 [Lodderomyces beijingensis]|uniref:Peroxisome assembly protein 22 n=1 Tax=Lodderomyces beijingensis TaxID=1775926 RepID=A0ABP0ZJG6_9ASCO
MMQYTKAQRNPKLYLAALVATSAVALTYKIYDAYLNSCNNDDEAAVGEDGAASSESRSECLDSKSNNSKPTFTISKKFLNKSVAITLSSSFLSSALPLQDLLAKNEKLIYIIPPNLNEDDVGLSTPNHNHLQQQPQQQQEVLFSPNFKILKCSNMQGYLQILKNLKPDCLLLCSDDLGINNFNQGAMARDLSNFIKKIVNIEQDKDVLAQIKPIIS